jgi:hypothetical protein
LTPQTLDILSAPHFKDDEAARVYLENLLWPDSPVYPHCGSVDHAYKTKRPGLACQQARFRRPNGPVATKTKTGRRCGEFI